MSIHVKGAVLPDGSNRDLFIDNGTFVEALEKTPTTVIDASGLLALPGLVDLHTHLREPGFEQSETVLTGSRAAAAGGYTAVFAMANTMPVQDTAGVVEQVQSLGERHGYVTVRPIGAVTAGLAGERLAEIVRTNLAPPPPARRPRRRSRGSIERRLADKRRRSALKETRRSPGQ